MAETPKTKEEAVALFREYEQLKLDAKKIEKRVDELKKILIPFVPEDKEITLDYGVLVRVPGRTSYVYSDGLTAEIERVDELKKDEQRTGAAKVQMGAPFIQYKEKKEEE